MDSKQRQPQLVVVIATYNERENLPVLVEAISHNLPEARILVVDDNSPDGTGQWVRQRAQGDDRLQLLHRAEKAGLGTATLSGLQSALSSGAQWIATMDADLSHRAEDLVNLWHAATTDRFDVILGSRYCPGGRIENWNWLRRLSSRAVNGFARWVLWLPCRDNSGALRIYRGTSLQQIDLSHIDCRGFAYLEQILLHLNRQRVRFHETPILFTERQQGQSKVSPMELVRNLRDLVWVAVRRR